MSEATRTPLFTEKFSSQTDSDSQNMAAAKGQGNAAVKIL